MTQTRSSTAVDVETIRNRALDLRKRLGLGDQHAPNLAELVEKLGRLSPKIRVEAVPDHELPLWGAKADSDRYTIFLRRSIFSELHLADPHTRWAFAHELGHLILKHPGVRYKTTRRNFVFAVAKRQELEAQAFASEFLMPEHLLARERSLQEIEQRFQITREAAKRRVEQLKKRPSTSTSLYSFAGPMPRFDLSQLPIHQAADIPTLRVPPDALASLGEYGYSEDEVFHLVVPKRTFARRRAAGDLLSIEETDKALRLKRIALQAEQTFGDREKATRWLRKPKRELQGIAPLEYLASESGARIVEEMLHRIEHGIFA